MNYVGKTLRMKMISNDMVLCGNIVNNQNDNVLEIWTQRASSGPTHKQTEGRAPVWGSEFTSKDLKNSI